MRKYIKGIWTLLFITVFAFGISSCTKRYKPVLSSADGINFKLGTLAEAKEKAKSENKPLFVFTHATWCPTCKKMEQEILIQKELGDTFNKDFVNVAIDLDSPEGHKLNELYPIKATPTLFFFKADGSLAKKSEGFADVKELQADAVQLTN
jgi:thioredoxin 1